MGSVYYNGLKLGALKGMNNDGTAVSTLRKLAGKKENEESGEAVKQKVMLSARDDVVPGWYCSLQSTVYLAGCLPPTVLPRRMSVPWYPGTQDASCVRAQLARFGPM
jgi:hypothetical protein